MTLHNRYHSHRRLQVRQPGKFEDIMSDIFDFGPPKSDSSTSTSDTTSPSTTSTQSATKTRGNNLQTSNSSDNDSTTTTPIRHHEHTRTSSSTTPETSTTTSTEQPKTTSTSASTEKTSATLAKTTTTSHSSSATPTSTSTSTSISTSSLIKPTSIPPVTLTAVAVTQTHTTGFATPTSDAAPTISATPSATPSAGLSTGAIVGSVAGGIIGLVGIFFIVAFLLRRWRRNRIRDEDFNPEDFVRSPNMTETDIGQNRSPFDPAPPNPAFRHHSIAPSIGSGPNMAGQGTYAYGNDASYTGAAYTNAAHAVGGTAAGTAAYGTYEAHDDAINGAYSSDPRPQQAYNAEAYGSYAYSNDGSHAATTGLQHAHPYSSTEYQAHYQDNARGPVPAHVPAPALVAGAPAVPANRAPSVYNVEDAYGGI
ncbi:hypothetical protein C0992_013249 [Termitomyces sp. T32_za158]|nr:hypothetical protein C0992_013249 [Termitomyces sp. T32_za158]